MFNSPKRFQINDLITFKDKNQCKHRFRERPDYYYGGDNQHKIKARILHYNNFNEERNCYEIHVGFNNKNDVYEDCTMLECEFYEFDCTKFKNIELFLYEINQNLLNNLNFSLK